MAFTGLDIFDRAVHRANEWLKDLHLTLGWDDRHDVYGAFVSVLRALRNRLPHAEAVQLGAQLPMILAGAYYAGWRLSTTPLPLRDRASFLAQVAEQIDPRIPDADPETTTRAVFDVLAGRVSAGELEDVVSTLPNGIRELWAVPLAAAEAGPAEGEPEPPAGHRRPGVLTDWNVVVTLRQGAYREGVRMLSELGQVGRTNYRHVLAVHAENVRTFLDALRELWERDRERLEGVLGHVIPVEDVFFFHTVEESRRGRAGSSSGGPRSWPGARSTSACTGTASRACSPLARRRASWGSGSWTNWRAGTRRRRCRSGSPTPWWW